MMNDRDPKKSAQLKGIGAALVAIAGLAVGVAVGMFVPQFYQAYVIEPETITTETTTTITRTPEFTRTVSLTATTTLTTRVPEYTETMWSFSTTNATCNETTTTTRTLTETQITRTDTTTLYDTRYQTVFVTVGPKEPIVVLEERGYTRGDNAYFEGIVQNQDIGRHESIKVVVALYDKDMNLLFTATTFTTPADLDPGEQGAFKAIIEIDGAPVEHYEVIGFEYD